ncbi:small GTP-binding protein domain protein [Synechococcus sp. PCC 7502]|uniref:GTP-binding protein n=1 Tax=Synechococcus sp. PCC 7502 TaxID=1173263 RepID=UPI00029FADB8|nr:GTP-binding protein [Synechococcus sp. PCC 7502]AFY72362.1 small GTP-binding protein domain protein [Synechococcus sp. PCC 7502]
MPTNSNSSNYNDFDQIRTELNYRQAQRTLRDLVGKLDLTPRERQGLEPEIAELQQMLEKLEQMVIQIAVFGMVGRGKSSVLNALLGENVFATGAVHGVTRSQQSANWQISREKIAGFKNQEILRVSLKSLGSARIELIDTPGIDEVDGEAREQLAKSVAQQADLILFVIAGDMTKVEYEALSQLRLASKPILLVFNKTDQYPTADRQAIYTKIRDERVKQLLSPEEIVMTAASPLVPKAIMQDDGSVQAELVAGKPQIEDLQVKILEVLDREGKSLVALNSMIFADNVHEQVIQRKMSIRDRRANKIIWNAVITQAVAIAVSPVTVIDLVSTAIIDVSMILALSKLYGISMNQQGAIALMQKIAMGMGGITASELLTTLGLGSLKALFGVSSVATGGLTAGLYISVGIMQASVAGVSSYAIGLVTKEYLANGATWGEQGPKAVVSRILSSLDEASILARVKDELSQKLDLSRMGKAVIK